MKRIIIAYFLLGFSAILAVSSIYINNLLTEEIVQLSYSIEEKTKADIDIKEDIENLQKTWEKNYSIYSIYVSHQHLEFSEQHINNIMNYYELGQKEAIIISLRQIREDLWHLHKSELPILENIL